MRSVLRNERGNIYVEALIAVAVLALGLLPVFGGWSLSAGAQDQTGRKNAALTIARGTIEPLHALTGAGWDSLPDSTTFQDAASPAYTITRTAALRPGVAGLKDVVVTVSWVDRQGQTQSVALATAIARRP